MLITIGNQTKQYMEILEIQSYPFTSKDLKANYRRLMKLYHTDVGGDKRKAQKINEAYDALQPLAMSEITNEQTENASEKIIKEQEKDMFALYETCPNCHGTGKKDISTHKVGCPDCDISMWWSFAKRQWTIITFLKLGIVDSKGLKIIQCRQCDNHGMFTLRSRRRVVCRNCNGTKYKAVKCRRCGGTGTVGEDKIRHTNCYRCEGTGKIEIKPFNPVIPKGAVL